MHASRDRGREKGKKGEERQKKEAPFDIGDDTECITSILPRFSSLSLSFFLGTCVFWGGERERGEKRGGVPGGPNVVPDSHYLVGRNIASSSGWWLLS